MLYSSSKVTAAKDYTNLYDILALRNQCFEKTQGQYTYSICVGKEVRQKDSGGGSSTLIGTSCLILLKTEELTFVELL